MDFSYYIIQIHPTKILIKDDISNSSRQTYIVYFEIKFLALAGIESYKLKLIDINPCLSH